MAIWNFRTRNIPKPEKLLNFTDDIHLKRNSSNVQITALKRPSSAQHNKRNKYPISIKTNNKDKIMNCSPTLSPPQLTKINYDCYVNDTFKNMTHDLRHWTTEKKNCINNENSNSLPCNLKDREKMVRTLNLAKVETEIFMSKNPAFKIDQNSNTTIFPNRMEKLKFNTNNVKIGVEPVNIKITKDFTKIKITSKMMFFKNKNFYKIEKIKMIRDRGILPFKALTINEWFDVEKGEMHGFVVIGEDGKRLELWSPSEEVKRRWMEAMKYLKNEKNRLILKLLFSEYHH